MDRFHLARISGLRPGDEARLPADEAHHLRVKRTREGDRVRLFDGAGTEAVALVLEVGTSEGEARLRIVEASPGPAEAKTVAEVRTTLAVAMPKGKRDLALVEKATELGVFALAPLVTRRTVGPARESKGEGEGRLARWEATALEAAKQCGRARLPEVRGTLRFADALAVAADVRLILDPRPPARPLREALQGPRPGSILALVGPEGGFTEEEVAEAVRAGFLPVRLGRAILRIETAAVALLAAVAVAWD